jgi:phage terminase Nu1 subunit (DNA packaging protein)
MQTETFTLTWLAQQLKRDRRSLGQELEGLAPDEEIERGERTERRWYLHRIFEHYREKWGGGSDGEEDQRQRLAAAQAERYEMENEERRGGLISVAEAQALWSEHISAARAKLLSMPTKLGPQLINVTDPNIVASRIRAEVCAALDELAEWQPQESDPARPTAGNGASVAQSADADGQRVG